MVLVYTDTMSYWRWPRGFTGSKCEQSFNQAIEKPFSFSLRDETVKMLGLDVQRDCAWTVIEERT